MFRIESIQHGTSSLSSDRIYLMSDSPQSKENLNYYTLLIGNNGCGKSRTLRAIASFFNPDKEWKKLDVIAFPETRPSNTIVITNGIGDTFDYDLSDIKSFEDLKYVYLGTKLKRGSYSKKYHLERAVRIYVERNKIGNNKDIYRAIFDFCGYGDQIKLDYNIKKNFLLGKSTKTFKEAEETLKKKIVDEQEILLVNNFLMSLDYWGIKDSYRSSRKKDAFASIFVSLSSGMIDIHCSMPNLSIKQILSLRRLGILELSNTMISDLNYDYVSSGESNVLTSMLSLLSTIEDDSLILIDEPEISLHPAWQAQYISLLEKVVELKKGCHVIIATHSHFLPSDLKPDKSCVVCLSRQEAGRRVCAKNIENSPYAWSAENILLEVFHVPSTRNYYFVMKIQGVLDELAKVEAERDLQKILENIEEIKKIFPNLQESDPLKSVCNIIIKKFDD